jgi:hypothetical protein
VDYFECHLGVNARVKNQQSCISTSVCFHCFDSVVYAVVFCPLR